MGRVVTIDEFLEAHPEYAGENAEEYRKAYEKTFQYQSERLNFAVRTFGHEVAIGLSPFKRAIVVGFILGVVVCAVLTILHIPAA